jgi:SulP family sulfate permease
MGVITALYAGFFGAMAGGSHFNIMGPTGALSGILFRFSAVYGMGVQPFLALISSVIILLVFALGLEKYIV